MFPSVRSSFFCLFVHFPPVFPHQLSMLSVSLSSSSFFFLFPFFFKYFLRPPIRFHSSIDSSFSVSFLLSRICPLFILSFTHSLYVITSSFSFFFNFLCFFSSLPFLSLLPISLHPFTSIISFEYFRSVSPLFF
uniref:Uncharacterized protein n=1 Tax=Cacopsylla melanoneura TaxID=428564 RepID=A0A8D9F326_9HEMI